MQQPTPAPRGFAAMSQEKRRLIASRGGKSAHAAGKAHEFSPEEAKAAGLKSAATRRAKLQSIAGAK